MTNVPLDQPVDKGTRRHDCALSLLFAYRNVPPAHDPLSGEPKADGHAYVDASVDEPKHAGVEEIFQQSVR